MLRHKEKSRKETHPVFAPPSEAQPGWHPVVPELVAFLDSFDYFMFLYDPAYRRHLDGLLAQFSDDQFETFERTYAQRFTMN